MLDIILPDDTPLKQCKGTCGQFFPPTTEFFFANPSAQSGLDGTCKQCRAAYRKRVKPIMPIVPEGYKRCGRCKDPFPATTDYFHADRRREFGLFSWCKTCESKSRPKKPRPKKPLQRQKATSRRKFPPGITPRERSLAYYHLHKEEKRQYYQTHKAEYNARDRNRSARKRAVAGKHTPKQIHEQYDRQKGKCYYCRKKVKWGDHHVDHTFPLSRVVGTDIPANDISYLVITCAHCNESKGAKFPWEWPEGGRLL